MIGSGIFIVSAESARLVGSSIGLLAVWGFAGLLTMSAALSCAELAAMLPRAGGQYAFFREAYGPLSGFLFGWAMFLVIQTGTIAAVAVAFAKFLGVLAPGVSDAPWIAAGPLSLSPQRLCAIAVIGLLTASNATGLRAGTTTQNVFTAAKLAGLAALAIGGLLLGRASGAFAPAADASLPVGMAMATAVAAAMVGPLFSQSAWNNVTFAGEEVRDPGRTLPFALLVGCLVVTFLYVLTNAAYLRALGLAGDPGRSGRPRRDGGRRTPLRTCRRRSDGRGDSRLDVRLRERPRPFGCPGLLRDGPRRALLPRAREAERRREFPATRSGSRACGRAFSC